VSPKLPEGLLLKNHIVARVMPENIALWREMDALMHIAKKHITLHTDNITTEATRPEYTYIHVSLLGSQPHSVEVVVEL
jgi:hypothetical protein